MNKKVVKISALITLLFLLLFTLTVKAETLNSNEIINVNNVEVTSDNAQINIDNMNVKKIAIEKKVDGKGRVVKNVVVHTLDVNAFVNIEGHGNIEKTIERSNEVVIDNNGQSKIIQNHIKIVIGGINEIPQVSSYELDSFKLVAKFERYGNIESYEKLFSGDIPDNLTIHLPYIEEFDENNNVIGKFLTVDNYNIEEIVTKDPNTYAEVVKDAENNEIRINIRNIWTNEIGKVYKIKFYTVSYYHFGTFEDDKIRTLIGESYIEGNIKLSDLVKNGEVKLLLGLCNQLPEGVNVKLIIYDKYNNEKVLIFNNDSMFQYLDINNFIDGEIIRIPYRLYYDNYNMEENYYFYNFTTCLVDMKALPQEISWWESLGIYFQKPKYTIEISGPNEVMVNEYKDIYVNLFRIWENSGEYGYINPKIKIEVEKPEGIAEGTVEIFAPGTVIQQENGVWYWEPWRGEGDQGDFVLKNYGTYTNIVALFKEAGQYNLKLTLIDTENNKEVASNELMITVIE